MDLHLKMLLFHPSQFTGWKGRPARHVCFSQFLIRLTCAVGWILKCSCPFSCPEGVYRNGGRAALILNPDTRLEVSDPFAQRTLCPWRKSPGASMDAFGKNLLPQPGIKLH
jgi:hypothetical protein